MAPNSTATTVPSLARATESISSLSNNLNETRSSLVTSMERQVHRDTGEAVLKVVAVERAVARTVTQLVRDVSGSGARDAKWREEVALASALPLALVVVLRHGRRRTHAARPVASQSSVERSAKFSFLV